MSLEKSGLGIILLDYRNDTNISFVSSKEKFSNILKSNKKVFSEVCFDKLSYVIVLSKERTKKKVENILTFSDNKTVTHSTCLTGGTWSPVTLNCRYDPNTLIGKTSLFLLMTNAF